MLRLMLFAIMSRYNAIIEHHGEKIAASGQDLGGDMLFSRRVGFSGTPSDLLPEELGQCHYDEGVDGKIYHYLTSDSIMSSRLLGSDWTVTKILDSIIKSEPPFHVLIDTGALITGMSNYDVARYLLLHGLTNDFDGVVFLDHRDRKMIVSICHVLYNFVYSTSSSSYRINSPSLIMTATS